jgi:hypothetical protein
MGNEDARFDIKRDDEKLGTIAISKGGIDYYPNGKKKPIKVDWTRFDELMKKSK